MSGDGIAVDIRVPVGRPLPDLAEFARRCEDAGLNGVGIHDHHHTGRDAYLALTAAAMRTTRLALYPATTNAVTRHPIVLAALAQSLAELAPDRAMLTLAPGFLSVERAGEPQATRERLRAVVTAVRTLLAGRAARLGGAELELSNTLPTAPKVLMLASGPKLIELAGEVADGVLMLVGLHPASVAAAREHLATGAARAGRDPQGLEEILIVPTAVGDAEWAESWPRQWFRPGLPWLGYPSATQVRWLRAAGIPLPEDPRPEDVSPALARQVCDALGLFGPAEHCAERLLRAGEEVGLRRAFLFPAHTAATSYALPEADVEAFGSVIGPRLQG